MTEDQPTTPHHRPADAAAAVGEEAGETTTLQSLWHRYRDEEHAEHFTDDEWAEYKKFFKRGVNFPDWLRAHGVDPSLPVALSELGPQAYRVPAGTGGAETMNNYEAVPAGGWIHEIAKDEAQSPSATPANAPGAAGGAGEPGPEAGSLVELLKREADNLSGDGTDWMNVASELAAPYEARWQADRLRAETAERDLADLRAGVRKLARECRRPSERWFAATLLALLPSAPESDDKEEPCQK